MDEGRCEWRSGQSWWLLGAVVGVLLAVLLCWLLRCLLRRLLRCRRRVYGEGGGEALRLADRVARVETICPDPQVRVVDGFLSPEEAQELLRLYEERLTRSTTMSDDGSHKSQLSPGRTSSTAYLPAGEPGSLLERLERRAVALLGQPLEQLETFQLLRYRPGEKYEPHYDFFKNGPEEANNRTQTALLYLNDLEPGDEGGATRFPKLGLEVRPRVGRVVVWPNCPAGARSHEQCDARTFHGGDPPQRSTKYAVNIWARGAKAR